MSEPAAPRIVRFVLLAIALWCALQPFLPGQTLPERWNRAADWGLQATPGNPWADSQGNVMWSAHHRRGGMSFGQSTTLDPAWQGWVSGGAAIYSGVAPIYQNGLVHECYYNVLWARHHLITPVVEFRNVTAQAFDLAIGGHLTVSWTGPQGIAHDTPVTVQLQLYDTGTATNSFLVDTVVNKPTPGGTPESLAFPVNIPAFTFHPQSRILITVVGQNYSTGTSWIILTDKNLDYVRSVTATEVVRQATPPNPLTLLPGVTSRPLLGSTWDPVIGNAPSNGTFDLLALGFVPLHQPTPVGIALCDPVAVEVALSGTPFAVDFPLEYTFLGLPLCTQGASLTSASTMSLSNALDITLGDL